MKPETTVTRTPTGDPLDADAIAMLRMLISDRGARMLVYPLGVSVTAIERAAAGGRVLRGTRLLITMGLAEMKAKGELPKKAAKP